MCIPAVLSGICAKYPKGKLIWLVVSNPVYILFFYRYLVDETTMILETLPTGVMTVSNNQIQMIKENMSVFEKIEM